MDQCSANLTDKQWQIIKTIDGSASTEEKIPIPGDYEREQVHSVFEKLADTQALES